MTNRLLLIPAALIMASACSPSRDYHGYIADEVRPQEIESGSDTRSTVLAKLGSPSTTGMFATGEPITVDFNDDPTWIYISYVKSRFAYLKPKVSSRSVTRISFDEDDVVSNVEVLSLADGQEINYASRETPTRGRELGLLEQIFGTVGRVALPQENDNPTDPRR